MTTYTHNSATEAVARARRSPTWLPKGMCLQYVWDALTSRVKTYGLRDANAAWAATTVRRYDRTPPAGAPVYWAGYEHGHVAISVGGGRVRSTDCPTNGVVSELSLAAVERRWPGLTYRGYGLDMGGDLIRGIAPTPTPTPTPNQEDDVTPEDRKLIAQETANLILWAPCNPGAQNQASATIRTNVGMTAVWQLQTLALVQQLAAREDVDVDEAAIGAAVVQGIAPVLTEAVGELFAQHATTPPADWPSSDQFTEQLLAEVARRLGGQAAPA